VSLSFALKASRAMLPSELALPTFVPMTESLSVVPSPSIISAETEISIASIKLAKMNLVWVEFAKKRSHSSVFR
jgi:hypothetical protein